MTTLPLADYLRNETTWSYLKNISAFNIQFVLPGVFADNPHPNAVNGSLWTLPYELSCYAALAILSLMPGTLRGKVLLALIGITALALLRPTELSINPFTRFFGLNLYDTKMGFLFTLGAVFACWKSRLKTMLYPALVILFTSYLMTRSTLQLLLFLLGLGILTLWLALHALWLPRISTRMGDWSYGAYLYGFPVQQTLAHYKLHEASFAGYIIVCTVITFFLAALSWHIVEKQALRWK